MQEQAAAGKLYLNEQPQGPKKILKIKNTLPRTSVASIHLEIEESLPGEKTLISRSLRLRLPRDIA